jgi:peptide/nickel transport system substrate-binding protein
VRIDPTSSKVVRTSKLGGSPAVLAGGGSRLAVATQAAGATHRGGTLRLVGSDGQPVTLDPATWWSSEGWSFLAVTNDGLLTVRRTSGSSGLQIVPDLARTAPLIADGGRSYTFQLRSGIRYSDGRSVRPRDVRASIERLWKLHSPATVSPELRLGLLGEMRCSQAPGHCDLTRGIRVDDAAGTVTFRLERPNPLFQRLLTLPFYDVLPAGIPARDGRPLPATGPYRITRVVPGRLVEAGRNPRFREWSAGAQPAGYPDRIVWHIEANDRGSLAKVLDGRADYAVGGAPMAEIGTIAQRHASQVQSEPFPRLVYLFLNTHVAPFDAANARRALNLAIDRRRVVELGGGSLVARPTCQIIPPSFAGYRPSCPYTIDPNPGGTWIAPDLDRARALLRKSGTPNTTVDLWTPDDPERIAIGRYVTGLLRTLGFMATLHVVHSHATYYDYVSDSRHHAQIGIAGWGPDVLDPSGFFDPLLTCASYVPASSSNANYAGYCDRRTDAVIRQAEMLAATDAGASSDLWAAIDRRVGIASPWVPLYTVRWNDVLSSRLGNYEYHPMFGFLIDQAWVK